MNATELFLKDGRSAGVYYCEQCRIVHRTLAEADRCCAPYRCDMCNKEIERYHTRCSECRAKVEADKERERFEKAEKLLSWDGWVFCDGVGRDGFSESISDFWDNWESDHDDSEEKPKYVWACKANHFVRASIDDITERMDDAAWEDWDPETLDGLPELKAAIDKFNEANAAVCSYQPDYTKAILLNDKAGR